MLFRSYINSSTDKHKATEAEIRSLKAKLEAASAETRLAQRQTEAAEAGAIGSIVRAMENVLAFQTKDTDQAPRGMTVAVLQFGAMGLGHLAFRHSQRTALSPFLCTQSG
mgnify:CR=1 FL=1